MPDRPVVAFSRSQLFSVPNNHGPRHMWLMQCASVAAVLVLTACDRQNDAALANSAQIPSAPPASIPPDHTTGFRDGYLVRVTREGHITWSGVLIDDPTFTDYMKQYVEQPRGAGRLWIEFEPGISPELATSIRRQVIASGLCQQNRCVEGGWNVKRPIVN